MHMSGGPKLLAKSEHWQIYIKSFTGWNFFKGPSIFNFVLTFLCTQGVKNGSFFHKVQCLSFIFSLKWTEISEFLVPNSKKVKI